MFITLLLVNLGASLLICLLTVLIFRLPLTRLLEQRCSAAAAAVWVKFILFLVFVIGTTVGTRIWEIEHYADPKAPAPISQDVLALEVYKTVISTLQVSAVLLVVLLTVVGLAYLTKKKPDPV